MLAERARPAGRAVRFEGGGRFSVQACEPVEPGPGEVRLRVAYCGVCGTDVHIAKGGMRDRLDLPQVIGHEMSGFVDAVGGGVRGFAPGDKVVVRPLDARGERPSDRGMSHICRELKFLGIDTPGAFQRFWTVPAFTLHRLPEHIDLRPAALIEPLAVATHDVRLGGVVAGDTVVVIGGGPIGMLIGLVAREMGAEVILSEINARRLALAREFGFDAIDPRRTDLHGHVLAATENAGADVVFEVSGSQDGATMMTKLARLGGRIVVVAIFTEVQPLNLFEIFWKELQLQGVRVYEPVDFEQAIDLVAGGTLPLERLITAVEPLDRLPEVFAELQARPDAMKILVDCQA